MLTTLTAIALMTLTFTPNAQAQTPFEKARSLFNGAEGNFVVDDLPNIDLPAADENSYRNFKCAYISRKDEEAIRYENRSFGVTTEQENSDPLNPSEGRQAVWSRAMQSFYSNQWIPRSQSAFRHFDHKFLNAKTLLATFNVEHSGRRPSQYADESNKMYVRKSGDLWALKIEIDEEFYAYSESDRFYRSWSKSDLLYGYCWKIED